jgi:adenylyltransferase/sulfurtransferase
VEKLKDLGVDNGGTRKIIDIMGGMKAWKEEVDPTFPFI